MLPHKYRIAVIALTFAVNVAISVSASLGVDPALLAALQGHWQEVLTAVLGVALADSVAEHYRGPTPRGPSLPPGTGVALRLLAAATWGVVIAGCGATQAEQHAGLNTTTDVVQPSYDLAVVSCDAAEGAVLARPDSTAEDDRSAITQIRETCDRVFGAFEAVRIAQRQARAAVDGGGEALIASALASLGEAWAALRLLIPEVAQLRGDN